MPAFPAYQVVMRTMTTGTLDYTPTFTGVLTVSANGYTETYGSAYSGTELSMLDLPAGTDVILTGNITMVTFHPDANVSMLAMSNKIRTISGLSGNISILDLRNLADAPILLYGETNNIRELYATSLGSLYLVNVDMIDHSTVTDGVLWIDRTQAHAADVIAEAEAKGWRVYDL